MIKIEQLQDTAITIVSSETFAEVTLQFIDNNAEDVIIILDMESCLKVIKYLDNGHKVYNKILPWWHPKWWIT